MLTKLTSAASHSHNLDMLGGEAVVSERANLRWAERQDRWYPQ